MNTSEIWGILELLSSIGECCIDEENIKFLCSTYKD